MTAREARTVRWGVAGVGAILLYVLLLDPYLAARGETRSLIDERESRLARLRALQASLPAYEKRLAIARETWDRELAPRLLAAEVPAVAASSLSEEVRRIAAQSFLQVERENVLPPGEADGLTTVTVQFSLRGDIYGLRDFLSALETSQSFLHLRELRVNTVTGGFGPTPGSGAPLQITVTLEGYLRGQPGEVATDAAGQPLPVDAGSAAANATPNAPAAPGGGTGMSTLQPRARPGEALGPGVDGNLEEDLEQESFEEDAEVNGAVQPQPSTAPVQPRLAPTPPPARIGAPVPGAPSPGARRSKRVPPHWAAPAGPPVPADPSSWRARFQVDTAGVFRRMSPDPRTP